MKKKILIGIAVLFGIGVLASASSDSDGSNTEKNPITVTNPPTTTTTYYVTTTTINTELIDCMSDASEIATESKVMESRTRSLINTPSASGLRSLIRDTRTFIIKGRSFVSRCGSYAPDAAQEMNYFLDQLEANNNKLEDLSTIYS